MAHTYLVSYVVAGYGYGSCEVTLQKPLAAGDKVTIEKKLTKENGKQCAITQITLLQ